MRRNIRWMALAGAGALLIFANAAMAAGGEERSMFRQFVISGGVIGWLLIALDVACIAIIIEQFVSIRKVKVLPSETVGRIGGLFERKQYREALEFTAAEESFVSRVVHAGLKEASHGFGAMERAMEEANEEETTKLLRKIEVLNVIGNVAPMLGLLGTVYGMIRAFNAIVAAGGIPEPARLADSIGIALVTTFWGLVVAIPALAVYGVMRNRIDGLSAETALTAEELIGMLRPGRKGAAAAGSAAGQQAAVGGEGT